MGRANRKHWTDTHPDRKMWSPGRLAVARMQTQEEYETLYGRSQEPSRPSSLRSFLWNSEEMLRLLDQRTLSAEERISLFSSADGDFVLDSGSEALLRGDRAFEKLFEDEWNHLPPLIGERLSPVQSEMRDFFADAAILFAQVHRNAELHEDPARDEAPSSLLATAIWCGEIEGSHLAEVLDRDLVLREILPQLEYIRRLERGSQPNDFLRNVWQELWGHCGSSKIGDIESRLGEIDEQMQKAFGGTLDRYLQESETARRCRVYRDIFKHIGGEQNLGDMFRESVARGTLGPAATHAVQRALAKEIERIFLLHKDSGDDFDQAMTDTISKKPSEALQFLRPFFQNKEELLDEAEDYLSRSTHSSYQVAETIRRAIWKGCERLDFAEDFHEVIIRELG